MTFIFDPANGILEQLGAGRRFRRDRLALLAGVQTPSLLLGVFYVGIY